MTAQQAPTHGARHLIPDVQRFGLLSAAAVVDRYAHIVDRAMMADSWAPTGLPPSYGDTDWISHGAARAAGAWLRLLETASTLVQGAAARSDEKLLLPTTRPGSGAETRLWVHNPTSAPVGAVRLIGTDLVSSEGSRIGADAVAFSPETIDVPPGTSAEIGLRLDVPADLPPGRYHGLVLTSAARDEAITLTVEVQPYEGPP